MDLTIRERNGGGSFKSLEDFCRRLDSRVANRRMLESLIKAGAFDFTGCERAELFACIDEALTAGSAAQRDRQVGQVSLFGDAHEEILPRRERVVSPWSDREKMTYEKELLGFYVTGHPLDAYAAAIAGSNFQTIASLAALSDRATFRVAGAITHVEKKFTRKEGKPFAVVWLEDLTGGLELVVWNDVFVECAEKLAPGNVIAVRGSLDLRDESLRATAQKVWSLTAVDQSSQSVSTEPLQLFFSSHTSPDDLRQVREILAASPGKMEVHLLFEGANGEMSCVRAGAEFRVNLTPDLRARLSRWLSPPASAAPNRITEPAAA